MAKHYEQLWPIVARYFSDLGIQVVLEPHGSRGPDIESDGLIKIVGEIKSDAELKRDLTGYWSQWNSHQRFGGKTSDYRLSTAFPQSCRDLNASIRGWLSVIYGQLRHYCTKAEVNEGWLIVENVVEHGSRLNEALAYLSSQRCMKILNSETFQGIGFIKVGFL